jgi:hypothetical protein
MLRVIVSLRIFQSSKVTRTPNPSEFGVSA